MPYSIPGSTKILIYILWQQHHFFILVGTLCVCEFAMVPGVYILLCPPGRKGTLFFLHIQLHNHQKDLNPSLWLYYYGKVIVELENNTSNRKRLFMVLVIWPSSTLKFLFFFFLISNNVWEIFPLGDHQITFVTLNRFCPLNKPPFVLNGQNQAGWNPKQNLMKNACLLVYCVLRFKGTSYKRIQDTASLPVPLFLVVLHCIRIYISRYHF